MLIDYNPGVADRRKQQVATLLDLAIHGYDDNSGIEHPKKGVRSSVGQDLSQVRSADLALLSDDALNPPLAHAVLLVDDEPQALKWFARRYGDEFDVRTAASVQLADL